MCQLSAHVALPIANVAMIGSEDILLYIYEHSLDLAHSPVTPHPALQSPGDLVVTIS